MNFNDFVKTGQFMYMAEANGYDNLVTTKEAKLNAIIREMRQLPNRKLTEDFTYSLSQICTRHGLFTLSPEDVHKIKQSLNLI